MTRNRRPPIQNDDDDEPAPRPPTLFGFPRKNVTLGFLGFFAFITAYQSFFVTDAGTVDIVLRFATPVRVTDPGLNFKLPFIERDYTVELRERAYPVRLEAASRDPMEVTVEVTLNWAVNKENVIQMYHQFGKLDQFEERIIKPRLPDAVKAVISGYAVNDLLLKRNELRDRAKKSVFEVIPQDIMTITGFAVTNVEFPKAYTDKIRDVQVAREAANAQEQVLRQQNFKAQEVFNTAKAQADATKAAADADAYSIAIKGKAQLDFQERQAGILKANPLLIDWERAQKLAPGVLPSTFIGSDQAGALMFQLGATAPTSKKAQ